MSMTQSTPTDTDDFDVAKTQSIVGLCRFLVACLLVAILATGVMISLQTQERHRTYQEVQKLKRELTRMQIEQSRLLIEQQTFSSTPQVARRAVGELGMFYPDNAEHATMPNVASATSQPTASEQDVR